MSKSTSTTISRHTRGWVKGRCLIQVCIQRNTGACLCGNFEFMLYITSLMFITPSLWRPPPSLSPCLGRMGSVSFCLSAHHTAHQIS